MKATTFSLSVVAIVIVCGSAPAAPIQQQEVKQQNEIFQRWWNTNLVWKFADLPAAGMMEKHRTPYSGSIYLDSAGGTAHVLRKYDRAFHRGRPLATQYEHRDIALHQETTHTGGGFFFRGRTRRVTPHWAGHCNGWTAAAIRHAEPKHNVVRNGVVFTPADIKGLLAELYVYSSTEFLGGLDRVVNPGTLHVVLANWLGNGKHPIGMDKSVGHEVWNYPIYAYTASSKRHGSRYVEVKNNIGYVDYSEREHIRGPKKYKFLYFHYLLDVNEKDEIVGGRYFRDSSMIDMLWTPLQPVQGGTDGNREGNPYLNVKEVLALWRASVPADERSAWFNINPTEADAIAQAEPETTDSETPETETTASETSGATESPVSTESATGERATDEPATEERATGTTGEVAGIEPAAEPDASSRATSPISIAPVVEGEPSLDFPEPQPPTSILTDSTS